MDENVTFRGSKPTLASPTYFQGVTNLLTSGIYASWRLIAANTVDAADGEWRKRL